MKIADVPTERIKASLDPLGAAARFATAAWLLVLVLALLRWLIP